MDLFEKCVGFYNDPKVAQKYGYPTNPRTIQQTGHVSLLSSPSSTPRGRKSSSPGRRLLMIGSNNYLGLTNHPKVKEAAIEAIRKYGTSCTGSRFLNGTLQMHIELEERLAKFIGQEAALVFSTGFQVNLGSIPAMMDHGRYPHHRQGSPCQHCRRRPDGQGPEKGPRPGFSSTTTRPTSSSILKGCLDDVGKLVVVDGVFSMGGDIARLPEIDPRLQEIRRPAHGRRRPFARRPGRRTRHGASFSLRPRAWTWSWGRSANPSPRSAGFIASRKEVIQWIQIFARPFIFSASLPPANVATVLACLDIIEQEPERVARVNAIGERVRKELRAMGYNIGDSQTPIIPIIIGDMMKTIQAWNILYEAGIYTNVALPPAVPPEMSLLRTSYMATHTDAQIDRILETFKKVKDLLSAEN